MEALTRNVGAFSRFLEIAARQNGQVTNISNIARDAGVARALSGRLPYPPSREELGPLLENLVFNEVRAYLSYKKFPIQKRSRRSDSMRRGSY